MTDYSDWKIKKSELNKKLNEYMEVAQWCNDSGEYTIVEDGKYYKVTPIPAPLPPTYEEVKEQRAFYRRTHIDDKTAERSRKMANGSWTEADEQSYLALDAEVTAYIEEHFPYPKE